jgi:membrane dipeptidase
MRPVFDGHNDALTADGYLQLAGGKTGGHLDLPRMRAGGVRGAIFAVFADGPDGGLRGDDAAPDSHRLWGQPLPDPLDHGWAAGLATRAAGRLAALELAGEITIARVVADLDDVHDDPALPPAAVLHVEGAEAIDPELETLPFWYEAGLRSLGPVWSRPNWFGEGVPFRAPSSPNTGNGLTAAGRRLVAHCGELGILVDLSHLNERDSGTWRR